ncbi:hypothetical protein [Agitococcus lubricus]|uniref:Cytochrome c domain-containing protein n=1 Tax=Agitococcus lubricus TaxID=1077255 RepID=A0A2T5IYX7_9GAMM|nr:hypothetical protein [Agitococcus lubricus]PTQ89213.1 hypothetical protein C8N29_10897 [Agitococcus lubricus]
MSRLISIILSCFSLSSATALSTAAILSTATLTEPIITVTTQGFATLSTQTMLNHQPFFQAVGNGRHCGSCHQENQGWTVTPTALQARFRESQGLDPIFRLVDGANSPHQRVNTLAQRQLAYSMLLNYGVIRIAKPMPLAADFSLVKVDDPYGYANEKDLSVFRRPLPSTNVAFLSTVMWDGRETQHTKKYGNCPLDVQSRPCYASLTTSLLHQAHSAIQGHSEFHLGLNSMNLQRIVRFEMQHFSAQEYDGEAGKLSVNGAFGGVKALSTLRTYFGMNDFFAGDYRTKAKFNPQVFTLYQAWLPRSTSHTVNAKQAAIARGEVLFNHRPIVITGVTGFNDQRQQRRIVATCSSCHSAPNIGNTTVPHFMNIGTADGELRHLDQPLYTFKHNQTGQIVRTTDAGLALLTGKWQDIGKFKVPILRGLAARAPYFHHGQAANLQAVIDFYNRRFQIHFSAQEKADLIAFLGAL